MITVYGISNCDTVKKARAWLAQNGLEVQFHDFKKRGLPAQRLAVWERTVGWQTLLNRRGTTWRRLDAATQAAVCDADSAMALMLAQPSLVKRPVVEWETGISVGFDPASWADRHSGAAAKA